MTYDRLIMGAGFAGGVMAERLAQYEYLNTEQVGRRDLGLFAQIQRG